MKKNIRDDKLEQMKCDIDNYCSDLYGARLISNSINDIIDTYYELMEFYDDEESVYNELRKHYSLLDYNFDELLYYRRLVNKRIKTLKEIKKREEL